MMLQLILMALIVLLPPQTDGGSTELPDWTSAPAEANLFVVKTDEFKDHDDAAISLLPTVRDAILDWADRKVGRDCRPVIESMPLEDFEQFIYMNQEVIHSEPREYINETVTYYRGYVRVKIDEQFFQSIEEDRRVVRLENRLHGMLFASLVVLGSLGILWCWLFMRHKSRGLYIKRIRWIIGGLIVLWLVVCYLAFQKLF